MNFSIDKYEWRTQRVQRAREVRLHRIRVFLFLLSIGGILAAGFREFGIGQEVYGAINTLAGTVRTVAVVMLAAVFVLAFIPRRRK